MPATISSASRVVIFGSLAAAAFMIRDGGMPGANITIYETLPVLGGSLDATGGPETGYSLRGGRMFTTDNYECTWGLFKSIPLESGHFGFRRNHCFQRTEQIALASPAGGSQPRQGRCDFHGLHHEGQAGARADRRG